MNSIQIPLAILFLCLSGRDVVAQTSRTASFIATTINSKGEIFIFRKPIPRIEFVVRSAWGNLADSVHKMLGKATLTQLFDHSQMRDTTYWTDEELNKGILVQDMYTDADINEVIQKFHLTDEGRIAQYKRKISQFNATTPGDKIIYDFSRPVFDDSGKFAIIKWNQSNSLLSGGGAIELYELIGQEWHYLGWLAMWRY